MKSIGRLHDLALYGAPPAFSEPLHVGYPSIGNKDDFLRRIDDMFERRFFTNDGPFVRELEQRIAERLGVKHCVAVANGTLALEIAIRALGLQGEVIVPSYTFIATAHALWWQGITPVFADINPATHNLDPAAVRRMITPRTTGIIGVHLWGRPAPVRELQQIADEHGLELMFDAAHAFSCSYGNELIGRFGRLEVFSFHATKIFNSFEGGAVTTDDDELAAAMRLMRNFGFSGYDNVIYPGTNGKLTEICAAMGLTNLDAVDDIIAANRSNYEEYRAAIDSIPGLSLVRFDPDEQNNYQYVVIEVSRKIGLSRDFIVNALHRENILVRRYFWPGCHRMKPYRDLFPHAGLVLPNTKEVAEKVIVLPTGPSLPEGAATAISNILRVLLSEKDAYEIGHSHE